MGDHHTLQLWLGDTADVRQWTRSLEMGLDTDPALYGESLSNPWVHTMAYTGSSTAGHCYFGFPCTGNYSVTYHQQSSSYYPKQVLACAV